MNASTGLLEQLIAEFQPEKKSKAAKPKEPTVDPKSLKTQVAREEYLESSPSWIPTARVHHLTEQTCQCCGGVTEVLGRTLIRHRNALTHTQWEIQRGRFAGLDLLPQEFVTHEESVEACPSCLRAEALICTYPLAESRQFTLFH